MIVHVLVKSDKIFKNRKNLKLINQNLLEWKTYHVLCYHNLILLTFHYFVVIYAPNKAMPWSMASTICLLACLYFVQLVLETLTCPLWCAYLWSLQALSYPSKDCLISLNFPSVEKLNQKCMAWCSSLNFKQAYKFNFINLFLFNFSHMNPSGNPL